MNSKEFDEVVAPVRALIAKKGEDYNTGIKLEEYFPFGHLSYVQMLHMKTLRLRSLTNLDVPPHFDSIEDSARDLLAYTVFYLDYLRKLHEQVRT